jgi:hypothetical protein
VGWSFDEALKWALLSWPDRPARARKEGESRSAKNKAKQEAALEEVQWRYPALRSLFREAVVSNGRSLANRRRGVGGGGEPPLARLS